MKVGDQVRFGQSTRILILGCDDEDIDVEEEEAEQANRKPIRIVSKKQNQEFLLKIRMEKIKQQNE